ncbi:MAG: hypothetical protein N2C12_05950 [Planctomycetales bacterium]
MDDFSVKQYFNRLVTQFGSGWNRFWFTPSDALPLSAIRILTGLFAIYVLLTYTPDVARFFQVGGLLPLEVVQQWNGSEGFDTSALSYFSYLGSASEIQAAHWFGLAVRVLFTIGFYSRITAVLALIVTLSYIHRAPLVTSQVEPILVILQFYLCLGPCGKRLSVDRWLAVRRANQQPALLEQLNTRNYFSATIAIRLIQIHVCMVVLMMGFAKLSGPAQLEDVPLWYDPWGTGEAVWWLIARPQSRLLEGLTVLRTYPKLVAAWTHAIVLFELTFPILVWIRVARPLMLGLGIVIWGSLALISGVAVAFLLLMVASISFYSPALLTRWIERRERPAETVPQQAITA